MKIELQINGRLNIELTPETEIERAVLKEMLAGATKGKPVRIEPDGDESTGALVVSMEK